MKQSTALVLVSDQNYLEYTKQVFYAAHRFGNWKGDYVLIVCDVKEESLDWFRSRNVQILQPEPVIDRKVNDWPRIVFQKLYLVHPMMKKWDKLVYMDTDTMILRDINRIVNYDSFAARVENGRLNIRGQLILEEDLSPNGHELIKELSQQYNLKRVALNVGVMVFNTKQNSHELFEKGKALLTKYEEVLRYPEQALFNFLFYRKWKRLPNFYNDYTFYFFKEDVDKAPHLQLMKNHSKILHFIGLNKPWHQDCFFHKKWLENMKEAEMFPEVLQIGENPSLLKDFQRKTYRGLKKVPMYFSHFTWLVGQELQKVSPKAYRFLKQFLPSS